MTDERVTRLFLQHQDMLAEYIRALVQGARDAEDLFQDTAVTILNKSTVPEDSEAFPRWARGVARNLVLHYWRSRRRERVVSDSRLVDVIERAYSEADEEQEVWQKRRAALANCMERVSEKNKEVLRLCYEDGLTTERIAAQIRRSGAAVRMLLHRLRITLADCVKKEVPGAAQP